jgi:plastocyanin
VLVLVATVAACGGGPTNSVAAPVATTTVDLPKSYRFDPAAISVAVGSTVTWTNNDNFTHSVQFLDGGLPIEPMTMEPGDSTTFTFADAGTYQYQCHLHPQDMQGSVVVQ